MNKHIQRLILVLLGLALFSFNLYATYWHLYYIIWWLDIPVHMIAGAWVALFALSIRTRDSGQKGEYPYQRDLAFILGMVFLVGIAWEIYEFVFERGMLMHNLQLADTIKDLCDDVAGGVMATLLFIKKGYNKDI